MTTKHIFLFSDTGEFTGMSIAQECPINKGEYLMPTMSTDIAPPDINDGFAGFFKDGKWSLVEDYREKTWYDKTTGEPVIIKDVGTPASNLVAAIPETILFKQAKFEKTEEINWAAIVAITGGFESTALGSLNTYPSKSTDQQNINSISLVGGFIWCENSVGEWKFMQHTKAQAAAVQVDMVLHIQLQQKKCADIISAINKTNSIEELKAIAWV